MGLNDFSDKELRVMIGDPKKFFEDRENLDRLVDVNHISKRRMADIMKYDMKMDTSDIKRRIDFVATISSITIDI